LTWLAGIRWVQAYRTGPQLPLAFAAGEFLETQKNAMGDFFSETWARTKQGFSLLWTNWNAVREVQARRNKGETISLHEYCMIARDKKDTGYRPPLPPSPSVRPSPSLLPDGAHRSATRGTPRESKGEATALVCTRAHVLECLRTGKGAESTVRERLVK
jgi:hypothetical protein